MPKILILADNRVGTYSQSIALAKELGGEFEILNISYSKFVTIPNFIFPACLFRYDKKTKEVLKQFSNYPNFIISAGRRVVSAALYLKKKSHNESKIIQIMDPNLNPDKLDLTILPFHDERKNHPKIINSVGALTSLDHHKIEKDKKNFADFFDNIQKKIIVLLVGGPSKNSSFGRESAKNLAKISSNVVNNVDGKLLVLTSPRTSAEILSTLKNELQCDFHIFDYNKVKNNNPYHACLGYGEVFIISGDSVSMISECAGLGKNLLIFDDKDISSKKHQMFHQYLYKNGYAISHLDFKKLKISNHKILNEAKRIANLIQKKFGN
ncbi:MAG: mitochondrial fission ELM1 family protein [Rickettsiales bacterium]|nr:mitochondrial fission ELM1 family protein [Rickettsiales bacterium]